MVATSQTQRHGRLIGTRVPRVESKNPGRRFEFSAEAQQPGTRGRPKLARPPSRQSGSLCVCSACSYGFLWWLMGAGLFCFQVAANCIEPPRVLGETQNQPGTLFCRVGFRLKHRTTTSTVSARIQSRYSVLCALLEFDSVLWDWLLEFGCCK